jgi:hypothetical protein
VHAVAALGRVLAREPDMLLLLILHAWARRIALPDPITLTLAGLGLIAMVIGMLVLSPLGE